MRIPKDWDKRRLLAAPYLLPTGAALLLGTNARKLMPGKKGPSAVPGGDQ